MATTPDLPLWSARSQGSLPRLPNRNSGLISAPARPAPSAGKMYALGALIVILPIVLGYLFGSVGSVLPILFAMWAKGFYVKSALDRIVKADKLGLIGAERTDYLQRAGGVSLPAGVFAGLIYVSMVALAILGAMHKTGH